jgi:hypothetical protein
MIQPLLNEAEEAVLELMIENNKLKNKVEELEQYVKELLWRLQEHD